MRFLVLAALAVLSLASMASSADASPPTSLDISARRIAYYSDRYIVTADGDVRVRLSDGTVLHGETFSMDLKLNRYLLAGDVRLDASAAHEVGAAFAGYPDLDRSYFLPATGEPDRWTYFGLDWRDRHPGREQPGDAFFFPDLSGLKPYIVAKSATIIPKTNVTFSQAGVRVASIYVPTPRYVVTFSANPHFAENAFFGARLDVAEPYNGSAHSLSALHLRNDPVNGWYVAFDQHFVWDRDWIAFSIDPLTQRHRQYNLIAYKRASPNVEMRLFQQVSEGQPGGIIAPPIDAASYTNLQVNAGLKHSGLSLNMDQYNWTLLGIPNVAYDMRYFPLQLEHPFDLSLSWTGAENRLGRSRLLSMIAYRLRSGTGYAHDQWGEGGYIGFQPGPRNIYYRYAGGTVYAPNVPLGKFTLTGKFDKQRTWFSLPHHVDTTDIGGSISRSYPHINSYLAYDVATTGDYWGDRQLIEYPPAANTVTTAFGTFSGMSAFRGFGTTRTAMFGFVWSPSTNFNVNLQLAHYANTPAAIPGYYGPPPWQFVTDVRFRFSRYFQTDLTRAYYFNFANLRWTPQWGIQFSP